MKYRVDKRGEWKGFVIEPNPVGHPDGPKVVESSELVMPDGKALGADVIQLFVRRKVLSPLADDTPA